MEKRNLLFRLLRIFFFTVIGYSAFKRLVSKRQAVFIDINEENISFRASEWGADRTEVSAVDWKDIKWIKQESNFSISVFKASSFSACFSIREFSTADQEKILTDIQNTAEKKGIRLVNFSGRLVWAAG